MSKSTIVKCDKCKIQIEYGEKYYCLSSWDCEFCEKCGTTVTLFELTKLGYLNFARNMHNG